MKERRRTSHECSLSSWKDSATETRGGGIQHVPPHHPSGSERTIKPSGRSPNAIRTMNGKPSTFSKQRSGMKLISPLKRLVTQSNTMPHAVHGYLRRYGMRRGSSSHLQRGDEMLHAPQPAKAQHPSQHGLDRLGPGQVGPRRAERVYNLPSSVTRAARC